MNYVDFINKNISGIQEDDITYITKHKIKYISDYVSNWLYVMCNSEFKQLNFIDCMCNAGIYKDGTLSTSMEVLKLFVQQTNNHPEKKFNLFLNDYNENRINVFKNLVNELYPNKPSNVNVVFDNLDVNEYLQYVKTYNYYFLYSSRTILFVDPYNFGTVKIKNIYKFLVNYNSELIFNYFSSDYLRNSHNEYASEKMANIYSCMESVPGYNRAMNEKETLDCIANYIKSTRIEFTFSYEFKNEKNATLYSIVYATSNKLGLEKIKCSFWKVFGGDRYFKNYKSISDDTEQLELFSKTDVNLDLYVYEAKQIVLNHFQNCTASYDDIYNVVLKETMLIETMIINFLLKPLINCGKVVKHNTCSKNGYKNDMFTFIGDDDEKN